MSITFPGAPGSIAPGPFVPVLRLRGPLAAKDGNTIASIAPLIDRALTLAGREGTVLVDIESPGGSPVQAELIAARLRRSADAQDVRLIALIGEICAAGAYWVACATDEIVAHAMSVVGINGIIGVEGILDGDPAKAVESAHAKRLLDDLHDQFRVWVQTRRGERLGFDATPVFSGSLVLGEQAVSVGLVDRIGDLEGMLAEIGGPEARAEVVERRVRP